MNIVPEAIRAIFFQKPRKEDALNREAAQVNHLRQQLQVERERLLRAVIEQAKKDG